MKTTPQILDLNHRHASDPRASRYGRTFPRTDQSYQSSTLPGSCGQPVKIHGPSFFEISNHYFADEAPRSFAVEAGIFTALFLITVLPIVNSVQAIATLIHTLGVL